MFWWIFYCNGVPVDKFYVEYAVTEALGWTWELLTVYGLLYVVCLWGAFLLSGRREVAAGEVRGA